MPRRFLLTLSQLLVLCLIPARYGIARQDDAERPPNIILILADDLGYGELGCYGQTKIRTPNLDRLAREGMRFNHFYSGSPVCAPSRCTLLTGLHTGHSFIRANKEMGGWGPDEPEGQLPIPADTVTLATILQANGYATGAIGKWGLGGPDSTGHPNLQGFDHFYGYLCQRIAHNYYPTHLWRNDEKHVLEGNDWFSAHQRLETPPDDPAAFDRYRAAQYAPDLMIDEALQFINENQAQPFFLYYATPVPHVALQVPADSLEPYLELGWDREPYLGQNGYLPHPTPLAAYAAMISRMDRDIGRLLQRLEELGIEDDTVIIFTSDNGPTYNGGVDLAFFRSAGLLRGRKGLLYEGGIRVPLIARWPRRILANAQSNHAAAFWDLLPTICELAGIEISTETDGVSFAPTLLGKPRQLQTEPTYLYWEYRGNQAVRLGNFKALRKKDANAIELYDLGANDFEENDIASRRDDIVRQVETIMREAHTESKHFPLNRD